MKNKYTNRQIEEQICEWSAYLLESGAVSEAELRKIIGEGLLKRALGAVGSGLRKFKGWCGDVVAATKEGLHDILLPNKGAKVLYDALCKLANAGKKLDDVKIFVTVNGETFPVLKFALHKKKNLYFFMNHDKKSAPARTLKDLSEFIQKKLPKVKFVNAIENIYCAEVPTEMLNEAKESQLIRYIKKNNLSLKDALKPETIEYIRKNVMAKSRKSANQIKSKIEEYFQKSKKSKTNAISASSEDVSDEKQTTSKKKKTSSKKKSKKLKKSNSKKPTASSSETSDKEDTGTEKKKKKSNKKPASHPNTDDEKPEESSAGEKESGEGSSAEDSSAESSSGEDSSGEKESAASESPSTEDSSGEGSSTENSSTEGSSEESSSGEGSSEEADEKTEKQKEQELMKSIKLFDGKFDKVTASGDDLKLIFGKSKKQIALDRSQLNAFFN